MADTDLIGRVLREGWRDAHDSVRAENGAKLHPVDAAPGFFKVQMRRGAAHLPARLWIEKQLDDTGERIGDDLYCAELGTDRVDPFDPPQWGAWKRIERWEWEHLYHDLAWCRVNGRDKPLANPDKNAARLPRELF